MAPALKKTPPSNLIPHELGDVSGRYVFVSREPEVTQFDFDTARPFQLADGRLAWTMTPEEGERVMNHHFIKVQRILFLGEA